VLHDFYGSSGDGEGPHAGLVAFNGTFYGTTSAGGSADDGTVFTISATGKERVIFSFNGSDGSGPGSVLLPYKGKLYGTTNGGGNGPYPLGVVYSVTAAGKERMLYAFKGGADGDYPSDAGLVLYNGLFYGTTAGSGGTSGDGTVFSISPSGKHHVVLYNFKGSPDGNEPSAGLVLYNGTFYGTTYTGGASCNIGGGCGTVFAITPSGMETVLHSFKGKSDGSGPQAALIVYDGLLYGTNSGYPSVAPGTVFSISTSGKLHTLHTFAPPYGSGDGAYPLAGLVAVKGTLYGTTALGGADAFGTVFSIGPTGKNYKCCLHSFTGYSDGGYPTAGLLLYKGTLFGTSNGQLNHNIPGTVYKLTP
jgi:uncharacterized repeat protein (TIGR03803 family)